MKNVIRQIFEILRGVLNYFEKSSDPKIQLQCQLNHALKSDQE